MVPKLSNRTSQMNFSRNNKTKLRNLALSLSLLRGWLAYRQVFPSPFYSLPIALCLLPFYFALSLRAGAQSLKPADLSWSDPVLPAVVQLLAIGPGERGKNRECSATGFFINEEGYLLTNAHAFEEAQRCLGKSPDLRVLVKLASPGPGAARAVSCTLVGLDEVHDLAVLKTERPPPADPSAEPAYVWLDPSEVTVGTPLVVSGHPAFAWQPVTQAGKLVWRGSQDLSEGKGETSEALAVDISLRPGASGSPVYREAGGVVGIIVQRDVSQRARSIAVPIRYAIELLNRLGVKWHQSRPYSSSHK